MHLYSASPFYSAEKSHVDQCDKCKLTCMNFQGFISEGNITSFSDGTIVTHPINTNLWRSVLVKSFMIPAILRTLFYYKNYLESPFHH
jgi:hypothetical protein